MTFPTIHLNGASRESLLEDYCAALSALRYAQEKLCKTAPNARDYYVADDEAYKSARYEHTARMDKINILLGELNDLTEHIADS